MNEIARTNLLVNVGAPLIGFGLCLLFVYWLMGYVKSAQEQELQLYEQQLVEQNCQFLGKVSNPRGSRPLSIFKCDDGLRREGEVK